MANIIPLRLMIPNILAQCAGAAAAAASATKLRGYPTGAIPIAPDGDIWTVFAVEGTDAFGLNKIYQIRTHENLIHL